MREKKTMIFKDMLKRYHISPLQYQDGVELEEKDYNDLYKMMLRYYAVRKLTENYEPPKIDKTLVDKMNKSFESSLIPFEPEELFDILMIKKGVKNYEDGE